MTYKVSWALLDDLIKRKCNMKSSLLLCGPVRNVPVSVICHQVNYLAA